MADFQQKNIFINQLRRNKKTSKMKFNGINKINILFGGWLFTILVLSVIPLNQETKIEIGGTPFRLDYLEHFAVFFILGFLYVLRTKKNFLQRLNEILLLIVYAVITEAIQLIIPGRTFNPWDLIYNILGFIVSSIIIYQIIKNRIREEYVR